MSSKKRDEENGTDSNDLDHTSFELPTESTEDDDDQHLDTDEPYHHTKARRVVTLGHRMESFHQERVALNKKHLTVVTAVLLASLVLWNGTAYGMLYWIYWKNNDKFDNHVIQRTSPYPDIVTRTVPPVQDWYENYLQTSDEFENKTLLAERTLNPPSEDNKKCLADWFNFLANSTSAMTSPDIIHSILDEMEDIGRLPMIRYHLRDYLTTPLPFQSLFHETESCLSDMSAVTSMACPLSFHLPDSWSLANTDSTFLAQIEFAMHVGVVLEILTKELKNDLPTLYQVANSMVEEPPDQTLWSDFGRDKYNGIAYSLFKAVKMLSDGEAQSVTTPLQINILEAVLVDIQQGDTFGNGLIGLDLMADTNTEPTVNNNALHVRVGKAWVDAYIAWNLRFVSAHFDLVLWTKLLIPSVTCSHQSLHGESFIYSRVISLALSMTIRQLRSGNEKSLNEQGIFKGTLGGFGIPKASPDRVRAVLAKLCQGSACRVGSGPTDSIWISNLDEDEFNVFVGFVIWITVLLAGYGLEILVLNEFGRNGWSLGLERNWKFAQFVFPWLASTTLGLAVHGNFVALLTLVPGLWKFGFPEVISYTFSAIFSGNIDGGPTYHNIGRPGRAARVAELANGVGVALHHSSASLLISMLLMHVITPDRNVLTPVLFLIMQHWFVLLTYVNSTLYVCLELILEAGFQWSLLSCLESLANNHWTAGLAGLTMLFAHYLFILAATIELVMGKWKEKL